MLLLSASSSSECRQRSPARARSRSSCRGGSRGRAALSGVSPRRPLGAPGKVASRGAWRGTTGYLGLKQQQHHRELWQQRKEGLREQQEQGLQQQQQKELQQQHPKELQQQQQKELR